MKEVEPFPIWISYELRIKQLEFENALLLDIARCTQKITEYALAHFEDGYEYLDQEYIEFNHIDQEYKEALSVYKKWMETK